MRMLLVPCVCVATLTLFLAATLLATSVAGWLVVNLFDSPAIVLAALVVMLIGGFSALLGCWPGRNHIRN